MHRRIAGLRTRPVEMDEGKVRAALHHAKRRDRGIVAARQKAHHASARVGGQAAGAGNAPRINECGSRRDLNAARDFRIVEIDSHGASCRAQPIEKISTNRGFDLHGIVREGFIAAGGAHRKRRKIEPFDFLPGSLTDCIQVALNRRGDRVVDDPHHAPHAIHRLLDVRSLRKPNYKPVAGLVNPLDRDSLECIAQSRGKLAKKKTAIAPFQPKLVVVRDDNGSSHLFSQPTF